MKKELLYKLDLLYIKIAPMIISIAITISYILAYFDIYVDLINYIFGTSLFTVIHLYLESKVFKFCKYYRMFIYYILINILINMYDRYFTIPIDDLKLLMLNMAISSVFLFLILYFRKQC